jgi:DNA-directed RNA polymerase subunit L
MPSVRDAVMCCNRRIVGWDALNAETMRGVKYPPSMEKHNLRGIEMKIEAEKKANELRIQIEGEGHSLLNLLQKTLLEDDTVEMAGYDVPHPLIDRAILYVRKKSFKRALKGYKRE